MVHSLAAARARTGSSSTHRASDTAWATFGLALVTVIYFSLSPLALNQLGFAYDEAGGSAFEKIHPGTLAAVAVCGLLAIRHRNPLSAAIAQLTAVPGTAFFLITIALLMVHAMKIVFLPFTPFIDTFVAPVIVFFLFKSLADRQAHALAMLLHALLAINTLFGLFEFLSGFRLTPIIANGFPIEDDWRSSAFFGHPLANASLTGAYVLALAVGGGRDLPRALKLAAFALGCIGMIIFGGRASSVLLLVLLIVLAFGRSTDILAGKPFRTRSIIQGLLIVPVIALAIVALSEFGFFDQFLERFVDDRGSAETRIEMFALFQHLSWYELVLAPDAAHLATLQRLYGLDFGIESFWVSFVLTYGLLPGALFFAGLLLFCRDLARAVQSGGTWVLIFFFLVASTSLSLSAKTPLFAMVVLMILVLLRPSRVPAHYIAPRTP